MQQTTTKGKNNEFHVVDTDKLTKSVKAGELIFSSRQFAYRNAEPSICHIGQPPFHPLLGS